MNRSLGVTHRGNSPARLPLPTDSEAVFQSWIVATARANGYSVRINGRARRGRNANHGDTGWPDLEIVGKGQFFMIECKAMGNDLYDNQRATIETLRAARVTVLVLYPTDWQDVLEALA